MKKLIFICFLSIIGCKSFNDFTSQKVILAENKAQKFDLENNQIIIPLKINNKSGNFLFDTGAMKSVLTDDNYVNLFPKNQENYYTAVKVKGATGDFIESNHFISDSISSEIIYGNKNIFRHIIIVENNLNCSQLIQSKSGILGFDIFKIAAQPILLNFEENSIKILETTYSTDGYEKLETKIPLGVGNKITIPFKIDGKEIDFLFDTGNNGGFLMSQKNNELNENKKTFECETIIGSIGKFSIEKIKKYKNVQVIYQDAINRNTSISVFPNLTTNTVGIEFIKQFNWILDFKSGNIFVKKISRKDINKENLESQDYNFKSLALQNKLIIAFKNLSKSSPLNTGDEIVEVNNQKVTPENICEIQDLLNKTQDWNTLKINVISKSNKKE